MSTIWRSPIASRASALLTLRGGGQALEFLGWVFLARGLGTSDFGQLSIAFFVARALGLVADWGATVQGTRDVAAGRDPHALVALARWRSALGVGLTAIYLGAVIASGLGSLAPLSLCILARGFGRDWLALGSEKGVRSSAPILVQGLLIAIGSVACTALTAASLVIGCAYVVAALLSLYLNRLPRVRITVTRPTAGWFFLISLAEQVFLTSDAFVVAWRLGDEEAGVYSAIYRYPNAWMTVMGLVVLSAVPTVTRTLVASPERFRASRVRAIRAGAALAAVVVVSAPLLVLSVPMVFGPAFGAGQDALFILLASTAVMAPGVGLAPIYYATRPESRLAAWTVGVAAANVVLNVLLVRPLGLEGAALATLLAQIALTGYLFVATRRPR